MKENSKLAYYTSRYNPDFGIPIAVITCSANQNFNKYFAEYYLFFPKNDDFYGCKISAEPRETPFFKIDFEFMFQEALKAAQGKIDNYLFEINKENNNTHYLHYDIQLMETNPISFIQLIQSEKFKKELASIRNKTKCKELQKLIDNVIDSDLDFNFNVSDFTVD